VRPCLIEGSKEAPRDFDPTCAVSYNEYLMTPPFLNLLKQIAAGIVIYEPFRRDTEGLREFQDTVHRLQEMERLGLVGHLFVQRQTNRNEDYVDLVMVQGGLTEEGKRLLTQQEGQL
jgi:hypothetical protein